jgi:hypothetical protein
VHCGLGVGLAAGKCCAERIGEQGGDLGLERIGYGVKGKTVNVGRSVSLDDVKQPCDFSKNLKESTTLLQLNHSR